MKNVSFTERLVHAVGYEVFAVLLCAPLLSWIMGKSLATAGALAVTLSVIAMLWNMVYNALVDRYVELTRDAVFYLDPHICMRCRYRSTELLWQCPQCHEWNTFIEERIAPAKDPETTLN